MTCHIIGIDCAVDEADVGLALGAYTGGATELIDVSTGTAGGSAVSTIAGWLRGTRVALLAVDAPLGWPKHLAGALNAHRAGQTINTDPNRMFRRTTDHVVQNMVKKTPLDVGADRIARTAHAALQLLGQLRTEIRADIPLAWSVPFYGTAAIEVYPAATLKVRGVRSSGYKKSQQTAERDEIVAALAKWVDLGQHREALRRNADILDVSVCVLAAQDFLDGDCERPVDEYLATREGWIWFRSPGQ